MKDNKPTISVIVPTFNRACIITKTIESVINQTYQDIEIIVVDDCSTDNTEEIIKELQKHDKRIRYIRHKENKGAGTARNTGIEEAKGIYIALQDSDDEWLPEKLEKQMQVFETVSADVGVVYSGAWRIKNNEKTYIPFYRIKQKQGDIHKELLRENFIITPSLLIKRMCFAKVGFFEESLSYFEDWEFLIRVAKYFNFRYVDEPLLISYYTSGGVNETTFLNRAKTRMFILQKHFDDIRLDKKILANYQYLIGNFWGHCNKLNCAKEFMLKAIKSYPFEIKFYLKLLILVFAPKYFTRLSIMGSAIFRRG